MARQRADLRRMLSGIRLCGSIPFRRCFYVSWLILFSTLYVYQRFKRFHFAEDMVVRVPRPIPRLRQNVFNITEFGGVAGGEVLNTEAFKRAVEFISRFENEGGAQLNVLEGVWLTAPFNLTSHMTLFLAENAVILGAEDERLWELMPPLPSYGRGRELSGPRYGSLIHGQHLQDVVITGHNGTIDGQGEIWWKKHTQKELKYTRGRLIQFMWSKDLEISDITLRNSPFWTLHPFDCSNLTIRGLTIINPVNAPNTDGIDPDSCRDMLIENCYISVGDDSVAIKSGWDQYGIQYGRPSANIYIRNCTVHSPVSAGISIGSEMSGGVTNISIENVRVWGSKRGVRIKTTPGRGGYVTNVTYRNLTLDNVRVGIVIKTDYGDHPDEGFDIHSLPVVENISFNGVYGRNVRIPARIYGSPEVPVKGLEIKNMNVGVTRKKKHIFQCSFLEGRVIGKIHPQPCEELERFTSGEFDPSSISL